MVVGEDVLFGLGQQVPHRGGGAWRYYPECNEDIYGTCQPSELFGLGQLAIPGGTGNLVSTLVGVGLIGLSFVTKGDLKDISRGLGIVLGGVGAGLMLGAVIK